ATERRMCMAFGVKRLDDLGEKVQSVLEMTPPEGMLDKIRALGKLKSLADSRPRSVRSGVMYRIQRFDSTTTGLHWQIHKDAAADWRGMGERMDVAVALGLDPITAYTASAPLPKHIDELMLAGF